MSDETIIAYKGFNKNWQCRGYQYEVGKTYEHDGKVEACESGFHAVEYPLDAFNYYGPDDSRFAEVTVGRKLSRHNSDTKVAAAKITINVELTLGDLVQRAVKWIADRIDKSLEQTNTGHQSAATNTGDRSAATNTGDRSAATNTGHRSAATNTGHRSAATNTGHQSAATNTGDWSAATNTGHRSAATNTGNRSAATNTGWHGLATAEGAHSAAISIGKGGRAAAADGCLLVLVNRDPESGAIRHAWHGIAGRDGIKPNAIYTLSDDGAPVEVEDA